jgi:hypothetical protein
MEKLAFIYSWDVPCYALSLVAMAIASGLVYSIAIPAKILA